MEDYCLGASLSAELTVPNKQGRSQDILEVLLGPGLGPGGGGGENVVQHQEITANHKTQHLKLTITVFFYVWEDARVWAH